jgi:hypothetical protein
MTTTATALDDEAKKATGTIIEIATESTTNARGIVAIVSRLGKALA